MDDAVAKSRIETTFHPTQPLISTPTGAEPISAVHILVTEDWRGRVISRDIMYDTPTRWGNVLDLNGQTVHKFAQLLADTGYTLPGCYAYGYRHA